MSSFARSSSGRRVRLLRSSMGEPMLTLAEAEKLVSKDEEPNVDKRLRKAAEMLDGYNVKGLGLSVAYLR